jgi:hypothetical protein
MNARITIIALLILSALVAGFWLGGLGMNTEEAPPTASSPPLAQVDQSATAKAAPDPEPAAPLRKVPLIFYAGIGAESDSSLVMEELRMATAAGITRIALPLPLPWDGSAVDLAAADTIAKEAPEATFIVHLNLNPPESWLADHSADQAIIDDVPQDYACPASAEWQDAAKGALSELVAALASTAMDQRVECYLISALEGGYWHENGGVDSSPANARGFREWLQGFYGTDDALKDAWGQPEVSLNEAAIPAPPDLKDTQHVFFTFPEMRQASDFARYVSARNASAIAVMSDHLKIIAPGDPLVSAPYGFTFEAPSVFAGHNALETVLASSIDAVASPVSFAERAVGGTGGYMGPVNAAINSRKQWIILDDTRTGIARNSQSGQVEPVAGLRLEDIYSVQQRNFSAALAQGLPLAWCDTTGAGALHDQAMWDQFEAMAAIYRDAIADTPERFDTLTEFNQNPRSRIPLCIVVDEESRYYQQCAKPLDERIVQATRDSALRAGLPVHFTLLSDVLSDRAPSAAVYLFTNAFHLDEDDRLQLHAILQREKAVAIWLYAPGYFSDAASAENIAATTGMKVAAYEQPAPSGSTFAMQGAWIDKDQAIGDPQLWSPLFYINDENASPIAQYAQDPEKRVSMAARIFEEGWSSIYVADPVMTPLLLRELLRILEVPTISSPGNGDSMDTTYFPENLLAIHAPTAGERTLTFDRSYDVVDAIDEKVSLANPEANNAVMGWRDKKSIAVPMESGQTRILSLKPPQSD